LAADVSREHVSDFITHLLATRSVSTASVRFRALHQLFTWLVDEEEIAISPMATLRPPKISVQLMPVLDDAAIRARSLPRGRCCGRGPVRRVHDVPSRSGGRAAVASGFGWALDAVEVAASRQNFRLCR
jgi:hypothetical protein